MVVVVVIAVMIDMVLFTSPIMVMMLGMVTLQLLAVVVL